MDIFDLECFRTTAKEENVSHAAEILHITQPALSRIITRVENYTGCSLFDRKKGKIRLNENGQVFLECVESIMDQLQSTLQRLESDQRGNKVRIASTSNSVLFVLLEQYYCSHPEIGIAYNVLSFSEIDNMMRRGQLDFATATQPLYAPGIRWTPIAQEEIVLVVGENSPHYGKKTISFTELQDQELMCDSGNREMRSLISRCFSLNNIVPHVSFESSPNYDKGFEFSYTRGASFMPLHRFYQMYQVGVVQGKHLCGIRLTNPSCSWSTGLLTREDSLKNRCVEDLHDYVKDYFLNLHYELTGFKNEYFS